MSLAGFKIHGSLLEQEEGIKVQTFIGGLSEE